MMEKKFYTNLKEERIKRKLSQEQLATKLNVTKETIRKVENGISMPNVFLAMGIALYFGKEVREMFWR